MTFRATGNRVYPPKIYSSISNAYRTSCTGSEIEVLGIEVVSTGLQQAGLRSFPAPVSWLVFEQIDRYVTIPDARLGDNIHDLMQRSGIREFPSKKL